MFVYAHLGPGFPGRLCLCSHGSLQTLGQLDVLKLHSLHFDTPVFGSLVQHHLLDRYHYCKKKLDMLFRATIVL